MTATMTESQDLTSYFHLVLLGLVLPLLFIAGIQLFLLSEQTETYFAWTFASPVSAAFMGAGYWAAMFHAYSGSRAKDWGYLRNSIPAALTATILLTITTFINLDKFHFDSPLFITRFVTWVWVLVYVTVPIILMIAWFSQARLSEVQVKGQNPVTAWMKGGFALLAAFALLCGLALFLAPAAMSDLWAWKVSPLAARATGSWLAAFGMACAALTAENDIKYAAGTCSSLFAFCVLELVVLARYPSHIDFTSPVAIAYFAFLLIGLLVSGSSLFASRRLSS